METRKINIKDIVQNEGQIPGLPTNPRQWTKDEMEKLKKSLQETPELFEARGIIVTPHEGKFIVLGGNMRLSASKALKLKEVPCIVVPEGTPVDKLKEIVIKDNGAFGEWDFDLLANEWDDLPLTDWGVPAWDTEMSDESFAENVDLSVPHDMMGKQELQYSAITLVFPAEKVGIVSDWIKAHSKEELSIKVIELCQNAEVK